MNHVYQIYLSNQYLYYYYSFLGEHLILADLVRWRRTRFTPTARSPSRVAVLILLDELSEEVAPTSSEKINIEHYLLENRWATGLLQELLCTVNI